MTSYSGFICSRCKERTGDWTGFPFIDKKTALKVCNDCLTSKEKKEKFDESIKGETNEELNRILNKENKGCFGVLLFIFTGLTIFTFLFVLIT